MMARFLAFFYYFSDHMAKILGFLPFSIHTEILDRVENILAMMVLVYMICALVWIIFRKPKRFQMGKSTSVLSDSLTLTASFAQIIICGMALLIVTYMTLIYSGSQIYLKTLLAYVSAGGNQRKAMVIGGIVIAVSVLLVLLIMVIKGIGRILGILTDSMKEYGLLGPVRIYLSGFMLIGVAVILLSVPSMDALFSFVPVAYLVLTILAIVLKPRKKKKSKGGMPRANKTTKKKKTSGRTYDDDDDYDNDDYDDDSGDSYGKNKPYDDYDVKGKTIRNNGRAYQNSGQSYDRVNNQPDNSASGTISGDGDTYARNYASMVLDSIEKDKSFDYRIQPEELPDLIYEVGKPGAWRRVSYLKNGGCEYMNTESDESRYITQIYNQDDNSYWSTNAGNYEQR